MYSQKHTILIWCYYTNIFTKPLNSSQLGKSQIKLIYSVPIVLEESTTELLVQHSKWDNTSSTSWFYQAQYLPPKMKFTKTGNQRHTNTCTHYKKRSIIIATLEQCQSLPHMEVLYVDILVGGGLTLTPQQQTLLCRHLCKTRETRYVVMLPKSPKQNIHRCTHKQKNTQVHTELWVHILMVQACWPLSLYLHLINNHLDLGSLITIPGCKYLQCQTILLLSQAELPSS